LKEKKSGYIRAIKFIKEDVICIKLTEMQAGNPPSAPGLKT
jgi:hypothetical protein